MSFLAIGYIIVIIEMFKLALYVGVTVIGVAAAGAAVWALATGMSPT